ncbi:MAG: hypothetical protein IJQ18_02360 [Paludibacteraceae bacterium]|nr:hypothetical protein [Paludibacteraceae bacterium]
MRKMQLIVPLRLRKMILTLTLAIASSVWTMKAACLMQAPEAMYQPFETVSGTLTSIGFPCEGEEPCPTCLTIALVTDAKTYYLSTSDAQMQAQLDELEMQLPLRATISGTPFVNGSFDFIKVQSVSVDNSQLPSLCDEWNVLEHFMDGGPEYESFKTLHYRLTSDTIFNGMHYVKFEQDNIYKGAMREGANADIYFVPANSTHEYLLYAFNAKTGDQLDNLWFGANEDKAFIIHSATVTDIESVTPRKFVIDFEWQHIYTYASINDTSEIIHSELIWLEGYGFQYGGPVGYTCPFDCAGSPGLSILCAYKNGEQVYVSEIGEQYGCEYNYNPYETPTDTIPLFSYTGDDPGSSTVDPVDPNQVVATLNGNQLTIHENSGEEINYTLRHNTSAQTPALRMAPKADSFREEVTISITESGEYTLLLTNPSWGYAIFGQFNYSPQGIDQIPVPAEENNDESHRKTRKILINGQILIIRGGKTFTLSGQITDGQTTVNRRSNDSQSLGKAQVKSTK